MRVSGTTANWQYDPDLKTEIEVRFIADGKNGTRVELEHRRLAEVCPGGCGLIGQGTRAAVVIGQP